MGRRKKAQPVVVQDDSPVVIYDGIAPLDYLDVKEKEIFTHIYNIGLTGTNDDSTRLKALTTLFGKIRPDKTRLDVSMKSVAPYDTIMNAIKQLEDKDAAEKGEE